MAGAQDPSEKYDQDFFLVLAAKGKDAWNAWRRDPANKDVRVTFAGIDFSEAPRDAIDFSGFEFGDFANFSGCKWRGVNPLEIPNKPFMPGRACFTGAVFGYTADFTGVAFGDVASFFGVAFGDGAIFFGAIFGVKATFDCAAFGDGALFYRAIFLSDYFYCTRFADATFGDNANFVHAAFGDQIRFAGAVFGDNASFAQTYFGGCVEFTGKSIGQWRRDPEAKAEEADEKDKEALIALKQWHEDSWKRSGSGPDRFLTIGFQGARFEDSADFSGRTFERAADFTNARFYYPPDFDAVPTAARIDFSGAHIGFVPPGRFLHWTSDTKVPLRLRALRKIAEETKNHDLERDLYIEERKAERGVYWHQRFEALKESLKKAEVNEALRVAGRLAGHGLWIIVMFGYWALADYGRSFARPVAWLGVSLRFFYLRYHEVLAPLMRQAGEANAAKYARAEWMVALGNAVPFVGPLTIDAEIKKFLFCPGFGPCLPIPPENFQLLVIAQNVLSIILVFSSASRCAIISGSSDAVSEPIPKVCSERKPSP